MLLQRLSLSLWTMLTVFVISMHTQSGPAESSSNVIESDLAFPSLIQWSLNGSNSNADISLIKLAWGPSAAPEMIAKANQDNINGQSEQFPDRVIALGFHARIPKPFLNMMTRSGLVLIKDAAGNMELPRTLTSSGMIWNDYDLHFPVGNTNIQYWDFFPVPASQKEFLFEVHSPAQSVLYFTVILDDHELRAVNSTPDNQSTCPQFEKSFGGSIGADAMVLLEVKRQETILSGTGQYAKTGTTVWLTGVVDSLGYFTLEERHPRDRVTGLLKGRFDTGHQTMSGYFSKPNGSGLQPFEFHEIQALGTEQSLPSHPDGGATQGTEKSSSD